MKKDTQKEIGELIEEITSKGFGELEIDVDDCGASRICGSYARNPATGQDAFAEAESLIDALGHVVDAIRRLRGEPTREAELAKMLEANNSHVAAPPVELGPDAACGCGSRSPLIVERKVNVFIDWRKGNAFVPGDAIAELAAEGQPGEIGRCPDCGNFYTFGA
jgi:hypothetical protein